MQLRMTQHAVRRMAQWGITVDEIQAAVATGHVVEQYRDDTPYPSRLLVAVFADRPMYVVVTEDPGARVTIIVTAYIVPVERRTG